MYYSVKMSWKQPKEETDEFVKFTKQFLVYEESVTLAEAKMVNWTPGNYQDATVEEVKKTNIGELRLKGSSETFWSVKVMDDGDGTRKPKPYIAIYNGDFLPDVVKTAADEWKGSEIEEVKKFKLIVDEDLISEDVIAPKPAATVIDIMEDLEEEADSDDYEVEEAA
jgi:hypothetical protein